MAWHFYWQPTGVESWKEANAREKQEIIDKHNPAFITALDLRPKYEEGMSYEELSEIHYRGPLYFDFDSESIEEATRAVNRFLTNLTEMELDLRQIEIYASGGKGYHIIVPERIYLPKPHSAGYKYLPQTFKEMAQKLYVDCLDMRVYSAKRGRMFRTANVKRPNGKYKVPLSVQEIREMTPELYDQLTSTPRQAFQLEEPVLNTTLARMFSDARKKVQDAVRKRRDSRADEKLIEQFEGELPPSVELLAQGQNLLPNAGFQKIATQIAITANALGMSLEDTLKECEDLIQNHQSDGRRYNTPKKRIRELTRMYHYMNENPCYTFSAGAIRSLLKPGTPTPDLDPPIDDPHGALEDDDELGLDEEGVYRGVRFNKNGIFVRRWNKEKNEYEVNKVSELGMDDVSIMEDLMTRERIGYEYSAYMYGEFKARRRVGMSAITSAHNLQAAVGNPESAGIQLTDAQAKALMDVMRRKAEVRNNVVTIIPREGIDYIPLPDTQNEEGGFEIVYAGPSKLGVISANKNSKRSYRLQTVTGQDGEVKSDLLQAPPLEGDEHEAEVLEAFFRLHPEAVSSRIVGYFLASFLNQIIRHYQGSFPLLQVSGEAGVGKTSYCTLCSHLHYYKRPPEISAASRVTPFVLSTLMQSLGSIPIVFDEFKVSELGLRRAHEYMMIIRNSYTGNSGGQGKVNRDTGTLSITRHSLVAPLVFLGEQLESQTAILDRSVVALMTEKQEGVNPDYNLVYRNRHILGQWGHLIVRKILELDVQALVASLEKYRELLNVNNPGTASRPLTNNAVILVGLDLGKQTLQSVFGTRFDETFENLKSSILEDMQEGMPENKSEPTKVLDTLAHMSTLSHNPLQMILDSDYCAAVDETTKEMCVDIHLKNAWDKYSRFRRQQGEDLLFRSEGAFITALRRHRATVDVICRDSPLKGGRATVAVVRMNLRILYEEEKVEEFESLSFEP